MNGWISARDALAHVVEYELISEIAERKLFAKITSGDIPCRADVLTGGEKKPYDGDTRPTPIRHLDTMLGPSFWEGFGPASIDLKQETATSCKYTSQQFECGLDVCSSVAEGIKLSRRHLLQYWPALANELSPTTPEPFDNKSRRRGPAPSKLAHVKGLMRALDRRALQTMKEVAMEVEFGASRDTCRRARDEVLSEFVGD